MIGENNTEGVSGAAAVCRDTLKTASCLLGVSLLFMTMVGVIYFEAEIIGWIQANFFMRSLLTLFLVIADGALIVFLILKGGCPSKDCLDAKQS